MTPLLALGGALLLYLGFRWLWPHRQRDEPLSRSELNAVLDREERRKDRG